MFRETMELGPFRRGLHDITAQLGAVVASAEVFEGLCHLFLQHTSASLVIQENADPDVLRDLETWFTRAAPDGTGYRHSAEGPDDMPAHIRAALTQTELTIPVSGARLELGTWQGVFLYEHRLAARRRRLVASVW